MAGRCTSLRFLLPLLVAAAAAATGALACCFATGSDIASQNRIPFNGSVFRCELPSLNKVGLKSIAVLKRVLGGQVLRIVTVDTYR